VEPETKASLKERAIEELKAFWIIAIYLWFFLGAFTVYRRLIVAETGFAYLHYGVAIIEALVIAKVILIGRMFGFSRRFEDRPLIYPVLYKSILFGVLVVLFGVVDRVVEGLIHEEGVLGGVRRMAELGIDEFGARILILIVAFIPFFAFGEVGRVIGLTKLAEMFFGKREPVQAAKESR